MSTSFNFAYVECVHYALKKVYGPKLIRVPVVSKHHNNTIRLTIQHKAALTTCVYR